MLEPDSAGAAAPLPALVSVDEVQHRLEAIFPASFPDRGILVGRMAAHVVFVFLYGGFIEGSGRWLRPSLVYFFTAEQARRVAIGQRLAWLAAAFKPGHRPSGKRWYADNSRESAAAFRKTFSRIAPDSDIWFSTEPDLIFELRSAKPLS